MTEKLAAYAAILREMAPALGEVEESIAANLRSAAPMVEEINGHVIASGGKRLRPMLMIISARLCGHKGGGFAGLGTVIEYLHSATLLHDDVLDEARLRRGNPSANALWGNAAAVLSGDFLYSRAFSLLVEGYSKEITLLMCRTAMQLVEGETLEISLRRRPDLPEADYLRVIALKTASLLSASCRAGAMLAGAKPAEADALGEFGLDLGLAFQVVDDVLDFTADQKKFGKAQGGDLREGTVTLPVIRLMGKLEGAGRAKLEALIRRDDPSEGEIAWVVSEMRRLGADRDAMATAEAYASKAREALAHFPDGRYRTMLEIAAGYAVTRQV